MLQFVGAGAKKRPEPCWASGLDSTRDFAAAVIGKSLLR